MHLFQNTHVLRDFQRHKRHRQKIMLLKNAGSGAKLRKETLAARESNPPPSEKRQKRSSTTRKPDLSKLDLAQGQIDDLDPALEKEDKVENGLDLGEIDVAVDGVDGAAVVHMHIDSDEDSDDESDFAGEGADGLGDLGLTTIEVNSRPLKLRDLDSTDDAASLAEKIPRKLTFGQTINQLFVDECEDHRYECFFNTRHVNGTT